MINRLMSTLKPQNNGSLYGDWYSWPLVGGLLHLVQRGRPGPQPAQAPPRCTPLINGQCTNFILFDVAL